MVTIRTETPVDAPAIGALLCAAFETDAEARLVAQLRARDRLIASHVAGHGPRIVGHIAFSALRFDGPDDYRAVGLAPLAVHPANQRQGIGARLIEAGLEAVRTADFELAFVLGEPGYYARFGFVRADALGWRNLYHAGAAFMVRPLGSKPAPAGDSVVRFDETFDEIFGDGSGQA